MSNNDPDDPLRQLDQWGQQAQRRVRRDRVLWRIGRTLTWPVRILVNPQSPSTVVTVVSIVALIAAGYLYRDRWLPTVTAAAGPAPYATQPMPAGIYATSSASAKPAGPFADTPAANWAQGEAGITLPTAGAIGAYSKQQVADSLAQVHKALIAGRLDRKMLVSHDPSAFLGLLSAASRRQIEKWFPDNFPNVATQIAPGATLAEQEPRVNGRATYRVATDTNGNGYLEIITNYVWAYPFANTNDARSTSVAVVHDEIHWGFYLDSRMSTADRGMWLMDAESYSSNINCAAAKKGFVAPPDEPDRNPQPQATSTEDSDAYFQPDHSLEIEDTCGAG